MAESLQGCPDDEAQQGERQGGEKKEQVEGSRKQDAQREEGAGVLGTLALFQRGGHAGGQEPVQEPVTGEHQAP